MRVKGLSRPGPLARTRKPRLPSQLSIGLECVICPSVVDKSRGPIKDDFQQIATKKLLYCLRHPDPYPSRLQVILRPFRSAEIPRTTTKPKQYARQGSLKGLLPSAGRALPSNHAIESGPAAGKWTPLYRRTPVGILT